MENLPLRGPDPTAVDVAGLSAQSVGEHVVVTWECGIAPDLLFFNVQRAEMPWVSFGTVNATPIPALGPNAGIGETFVFTDTVAGGFYAYRLEVVGVRGTSFTDSVYIYNQCKFVYLPLVLRFTR